MIYTHVGTYPSCTLGDNTTISIERYTGRSAPRAKVGGVFYRVEIFFPNVSPQQRRALSDYSMDEQATIAAYHAAIVEHINNL